MKYMCLPNYWRWLVWICRHLSSPWRFTTPTIYMKFQHTNVWIVLKN